MSAFPTSHNIAAVIKNWAPKLDGLSTIIEEFIGSFFWQDWDGQITGSGGMIFTVGDYKDFRYLKVRNTVFISAGANGTTSGVDSNTITIPTPILAREAANNTVFAACIFESASSRRGAFGLITDNGASITIRKYDQTNIGIGTNRRFMVSGFYEAA
jgi:hypothetical protein